MSIVGTRPPLISETNLYELHHRARLAIKPGITGMWQVSGRSDITDFEEVVRLDKEYAVLHVCSFVVGIMIFPAVTVFANITTVWSIARAGKKSNVCVLSQVLFLYYGLRLLMLLW